MIIDFKTRLFCAATNIPRREVDAGDPLWAARINAYFDGANGFPRSGDPDEYGIAFETVLPSAAERRDYIEQMVSRGSPSYGHRVLASLVSLGLVPAVFTTNFDPLVENATIVANDLLEATSRVSLTVAALDSVERAERVLRDGAWPLLAKLHGDYLSERLKNTGAETQRQDAGLRRALIEACQRFGLLIVGYSGRDESVMDALGDALSGASPFPGGLFWCVRPGHQLSPKVQSFLSAASERGVDVKLVEAENFDELCGEFEGQMEFPASLVAHVTASRPDAVVIDVELPTVQGANFPVLRCAALPLLGVPTEARQIVLNKAVTTPELRSILREAQVRACAVSIGNRVLAFGKDEDLIGALSPLGARLDATAAINPEESSLARGLLYDAVTRGIARGRPLRAILRTRGHALVVAPPHSDRTDDVAGQRRRQLSQLTSSYSDKIVGTVPTLGYSFAEGIRIRLERWLDRWWVVFDPYTWVDIPRDEGSEPAPSLGEQPRSRKSGDPVGDWRRERWALRYNAKWSSIIDAWAHLLAPSDETELFAFGFPEQSIDARFILGSVTAWSRPGHSLAKGPS